MLRCLIRNNPKTWDLVIPQAEFAYNNSVIQSTKKTPFEDAYGLKPQRVLDLVPLPQEARVSDARELFADQIRKIHDEVKAALKASNAAYSLAANQHRRSPIFNISDLYLFDGFDGIASTIDDQVQYLSISKAEVIEEVLDVKEVRSR
ncbi:Uncharacterized protein TCM_033704 [Theobroma cacao]|uniref:Uncharacterized protein n=1 Tax=Theobroma cacao TaxID=3641 RepID=A0A061FIK9_THECC|nr:Uncharacterized protein TCM_033704 [Theobroma cacao]